MQQPDSAGKGVLKRIIGTNSDSKTTPFPLHHHSYAPPAWHAVRHAPRRVSVVGRRTSPCGGLNVCLSPGRCLTGARWSPVPTTTPGAVGIEQPNKNALRKFKRAALEVSDKIGKGAYGGVWQVLLFPAVLKPRRLGPLIDTLRTL